jgi:DNA-directed RNA polymerase specialized sigma24 family protein
MGYDEFKNLSHEDLKLFEERLTAFFKMSVDDSFVQLRKHLENRFSRLANADELIDTTISRLIRKVAEYERRGERILDLKAFALRMASLIVHEFERAKKRAMPLDPDASPNAEATSRPRELSYRPDSDIRAIEKEIETDCMKACLKELSADKQALLMEYYPDESVKPQEKKELRERLAIREAGGASGTEASQRLVNNLQVKVSKLRSKLNECFDKCLNAKTSRDSKLAFLEAQRTGG